MKTAFYRPGAVFLILTMVIASFVAPATEAAEPRKVAILPFDLHAEEDLVFLKKGIAAVLTSRLSWSDRVTVMSPDPADRVLAAGEGPMSESRMRDIGVELDVDYVLYGRLKALGASVEIDVKLADVSGRAQTLTFDDRFEEMDAVIPGISRLADKINREAFGRAPMSRPAPDRGSGGVSSVYAHPERLLEERQPAGPSEKPQMEEDKMPGPTSGKDAPSRD